MELELQREKINCYQMILDTTVCQEETQEAIVPDACPDILRLLDTRAQTCLTGKQLRDGAVTITGLVRAYVLYLPDGDSGVQRVEVTVPFTCQAEAPGLVAQGGCVSAAPRVRCAEARLLNPRKILLRADLAIDIQAYQGQCLDVCTGVDEGTHSDVCQLVTEARDDLTIAVQEKPFTFSDLIDLPTSDRNPLTILSVLGEPYCNESKLIGSKLIFKGNVDLEILAYNGAELKSIRQAVPFSQIMEISGAGEDCTCQVRVTLSDLTLHTDTDHPDSREITLELLAQAAVFERRQLTVLQDLYSTACQMDTKSITHQFSQVLEQGSRSIPVRELMETTTMVRTVSHCWADLGELHASRDGDQTVISTEVAFTALYLDDMEQLQSVHRTFEVQCRAEAAGQGEGQFWCSAPRELFAAPAAGGLEVRFSLEFHYLICAVHNVDAVDSASLGEEIQRGEGSHQPSVILRLPAAGERLWDIAKSYGTTSEEILQANELEEDTLPIGKMLLIPKLR